MAPTTLRLFGCRYMLTAELEEYTFRIDFIVKRSYRLSSSYFCRFRSSKLIFSLKL